MKPPTLDDEQWINDQGLANIEALVPKMAQDFELAINNAWARSVQAHFKWDEPADVMARADSIYALVEAAMCIDTLCKNLRAERTETERLRAEADPDSLADRLRAWIGTCRDQAGPAAKVLAELPTNEQRLFGDGFSQGVLEALAQTEKFLDQGFTTGEPLT